MLYYRHSKFGYKGNRRRFRIIGTIAAILVVVLLLSVKLYRCNTPYDTQYDSIILEASKRYAIDPMLIKAVIWREGDFDPDAVGSKGEIGLMQLMANSSVKDWTNHTKRKISDKGILFDPELNIEIGTWYLARSRRNWLKYNDCDVLALAGYNAGYSNVKKVGACKLSG